MILKRLISVFILIFSVTHISYALSQNAQESDQQIMDFSLAGFEERGKKTWDLAGKSADIFTDIVKLKEVVGNLYGKEEDINLTADRGTFDKVDGKVHLEENVVITTSKGAKLTTDSLDWDRKKEMVSTKDIVNIVREDMFTVAEGAVGEPNLNKVTLQKDVKVDIVPKEEEKSKSANNRITITCDGPLQINYEKNIATFQNNVKVDSQDVLIYSDIMEVYFISSGNKGSQEREDASSMMGTTIEKIISRGNVKIVRGENVSYSDEAVYSASDKKITLSGKPKLIIYSAEDLNAAIGD